MTRIRTRSLSGPPPTVLVPDEGPIAIQPRTLGRVRHRRPRPTPGASRRPRRDRGRRARLRSTSRHHPRFSSDLVRSQSLGRLAQHDSHPSFAAAHLTAVTLPRPVGGPPVRRPSSVGGDHRQHHRVPPTVGPPVDARRCAASETLPWHPPSRCAVFERSGCKPEGLAPSLRAGLTAARPTARHCNRPQGGNVSLRRIGWQPAAAAHDVPLPAQPCD